MSYVINTNIASMNAYAQSSKSNKALAASLEKLSSGERINRAADDSSGMAIADGLRSQANAIGQAITNANDGIGIIQIADKAMAEQVNIIDAIKTKATQAAQDAQSSESRRAIQTDIRQLMAQLDNIASTTNFNGKQLLSGNFVNKEFQVGAFSRNTVSASISATSSDKIGHIRTETSASNESGNGITEGTALLKFEGTNIPGGSMTIESVEIGYEAGQGIGVLSEAINRNSDVLGVRASYKTESIGSAAVSAGDVENLVINGTTIGSISGISANDSDGRLAAAINDFKNDTGVVATIDERGHLRLTSSDGRGINIESGNAGVNTLNDIAGVSEGFNGGRLTLTSMGAKDIIVSDVSVNADGTGGVLSNALSNSSDANINLRSMLGGFTGGEADAIGAYSSENMFGYGAGLTAGVTTLEGAMVVMDIADASLKQLDLMRSNLGSIQNQFEATVSNLQVAEVTIKASESAIRDVDFAKETANFSKNNILVQSGAYALSQANIVQQNVLRLLQ
ncbi:Flagellin FliC [Thiovulum sp. ES]|nr:Flagellin FliC [Thiovulum sp. ES]